MSKCAVCRRTTFWADEQGWCLECLKGVRVLDAPYLKQSGPETQDSKTTSTSTTTSTEKTTLGTLKNESNGPQNGVIEKPQTPIATDLESEDDDTEPMDSTESESDDWAFHCPHCGILIDDSDMDDYGSEEWGGSGPPYMTKKQEDFYDKW